MAVKGKDLSYEAQEPAFLRRLRAQQAGYGDPDRHERPVARPARMKTANVDDDDGPIIIDEENNRTLSKEEYKAMLAEDGTNGAGHNKAVLPDPPNVPEQSKEHTPVAVADERIKQEVTQAGQAQKKRKAAKIVGADNVNNEDATTEESTEKSKTSTSKPRKKAKAVALSFDDGDG